ncbi:MAG: ABC transporter transmembrane domain-containing protein, partial [Rivularia sp. ALOHA_DT_140]|nr:ABC transporter transmembrane domain-containing protein [Rivularia sp. ALOHA_DT_140]
ISISLLARFFQHILSLPKAVFSQWQVGDFTIRLQENENILELVSQSGFTVIINSITSLFYIVVLLNMNPKLAGVGLVFVAANALVVLVSTPLLRANDRKVFETQRRWESYLIATVNGIETVKSIATENLFFQEGIDLMVKSHKAVFKGALLSFNIGIISNIITEISTICILGYGALLVLPSPLTGESELTIGELVAFNAMLGILMGSLQSLIDVWDEIQKIRISLEKINDVLVLPTEKQDPTAIMPQIVGKVKLENVYFRYENSQKDVLQNINLEVLPGEKIAIVGKSGSGKSTLVNLLCKLLNPTQGKMGATRFCEL